MAVTAIPRSHMTQADAQTRIDLAACYRLVDLFGWSDLINTRITARVPGQGPDAALGDRHCPAEFVNLRDTGCDRRIVGHR